MTERLAIIKKQQQQQQQLAEQSAGCQNSREKIDIKQQEKVKIVLDSMQICQLHNQKCQFISISPSESALGSIFQCQGCVEVSQNQGQFLEISQILEEGQDTIFSNWPFINNQHLIEQIKTYSIRRKNNFTWRSLFKDYFQRTRQDLCDNIDRIEDSIRGNVENIEKNTEIVLSEYNKCSAKEGLKQVILDGFQEGLEGIDEKIKRIVDNARKDSKEKEDMLESLVLNVKKSEEIIDLENCDKVKKMAITCLSQMEVFKEEKQGQKEEKRDVELIGEEKKQFEVIQQMLQSVTKELKKVQKLSREFKQRVKQEKNIFNSQIQGYLETESVQKTQVIDKKEKQENLTENEREQQQVLEKNDDKVEQTLETEQKKEKGNIEKQKERKDNEKRQEKQNKEGSREELRKNNGIVEFEENIVFQETEGVDGIELTEDEMIQLAMLESQNEEMLKMELEENNKNKKDQESNVPSLVVDLKDLSLEQQVQLAIAMSVNQTMTKNEIDQLIKSFSIEKENSNRQNQQNKDNKIESNQQEDVFEDNQDISNLNTIDLGWHLSKESPQNAVAFESWYADGTLITQEKSVKCTVVTNEILDNSCVYSFSCSFSKPLNGVKGITVGLIDGRLESQNKIGDNYFGSCFGEGALKVTKGEVLNGDSLCTALTKIKFKVCIKDGAFEISDSSAENVNQGSENEINKDGEYRLAIGFDYPGDDLEVLVSRSTKDKDEIKE